jgi:hypothetical protein
LSLSPFSVDLILQALQGHTHSFVVSPTILLIEQYNKRHERATKPRNTETNESRKTPRVAANAKKGKNAHRRVRSSGATTTTQARHQQQRWERIGRNDTNGAQRRHKVDAATTWTQQQQQAAASSSSKQQQGARKQLILF